MRMMSRRTNKRPASTQEKVLVIRDSADASLDYYLSRARAEHLFDVGRLCMVNVYNKWDYATCCGEVVL